MVYAKVSLNVLLKKKISLDLELNAASAKIIW